MNRLTKSDKLYVAAIKVFVFFIFIIILLPLVNLLAVSFSSPAAIAGGKVFLFPQEFTLEAYKAVFSENQFFTAIKNNFIVTLLGSVIGVVLCIAAAYPLSKKDLPYRGIFMVLFIFTMMFGGGIVPTYLLIQKMHLLNSLAALILPVSLNVFNLLIAKSFFETLPDSIEEAAKVDGASYFKVLLKIVLPIALPMIATLFLFFAVSYWNEYFNAKLYITDASKITLQMYLRSVLFEDAYQAFDFGSKGIDASLVSYQNVNNALIFCSMLPIVLLYPFIQRYFIGGLTIGSVKG